MVVVRLGTVELFSYVTHSFVGLTERAVAESLCEAVSTPSSHSPDYISPLAPQMFFPGVVALLGTRPRHSRSPRRESRGESSRGDEKANANAEEGSDEDLYRGVAD